jgi:hypothetical protein
MMVDDDNKIAGFHISQIRKFFKNVLGITTHYIQATLGISEEDTYKVIERLQELNYLNKTPDPQDKLTPIFGESFGITVQGMNFGLSDLKPMERKKAEKMFSHFCARVKKVNEDPAYLYRVTGFKLFGSYIGNEEIIDHIDLIVSVELTEAGLIHFENQSGELAKFRKGKKMGVDYFYSEIKDKLNVRRIEYEKVISFLKSSSAYINLWSDFYREIPIKIDEWKEFDPLGNLLNHYSEISAQSEQHNTNIVAAEKEGKPIGEFVLTEKERKVSKKEISEKIVAYNAMVNMHGLVLNEFSALLKAMYQGCVFPECRKENSRYRGDIVRKARDNKIILYEVKTYPTALASIRMALGQLLEYAFYPVQELSHEFYIVSHLSATKNDLLYLQHISDKFKLTIGYIHYNIETKQIEPNP